MRASYCPEEVPLNLCSLISALAKLNRVNAGISITSSYVDPVGFFRGRKIYMCSRKIERGESLVGGCSLKESRQNGLGRNQYATRTNNGVLIKSWVKKRKNSPNTTYPCLCIFLHYTTILIIKLRTFLCTLECFLGLYFLAHSPWPDLYFINTSPEYLIFF